ncbi:TolC family protein [Vibrio comitans]|uniref:Outer membrane channel protein TolC n=1 Tax=Vibrio comitans NBRC 102076 TaxID=1219078 RepID=A0A4Y3IT82_9VIBR|nr:TolC family protein [Vibrio comitans]GEA61940.1 outer membrane channel protein TolC [Vibrio comitans NBRC 102076]
MQQYINWLKAHHLMPGVFLAYAVGSYSYANDIAQVIEMALNNNLEIAASRLSIEESEADLGVSRSKFLPSLTGAADTTWNENKSELHTIPDTQSSYNSHSYSLSFTQSIFNLSDIFAHGTSKLNFSVTEVNHDIKVKEVIESTAIDYFEYLKNRAQLSATNAELHSSSSRYDQMKRNVELGNVAGSELYEVLAQKEGIANRLRSLKKDRDIILNRLNSTVQYPVTPMQDLKPEVLFDLINEHDKSELIKDAIKYNNSVLVSKLEVEIAKRTLRESGSDFLPNVSLTGSYRNDDSNNYDKTDLTATGKSESVTLGLNLSVPILSGGSNYYSYNKNSTTLERRQILLENTFVQTRDSTYQSILNINDLSQAISTFETIIKANYSSYKGIQRAYQLGTRTITDLLAAETKLFNSLRDYQNARYDYVIESIKLDRLIGTLNIESVNKVMSMMVNISQLDKDYIVPPHLIKDIRK